MSSLGSARFHAVFSAYLSILAGLVEFVLSLMAGHEEDSMSLYGIALMAFVDITGSVLVLLLWQCSSAAYGSDRPKTERLKEMQYSIVIGYLMICLGVFLISDSIKTLVFHDVAKRMTDIGFTVAVFGATCSVGLAIYKYFVGLSLDSPVVIADSVSSLCSGLTSAAALIVAYIHKEVWWADSAAGFATALYTLYSGMTTVFGSHREITRMEIFDNRGMFNKSRLYDEVELGHYYRNGRLVPKTRGIFQMIAENFSWFRSEPGYDRLPDLDSEIDEEITFST